MTLAAFLFAPHDIPEFSRGDASEVRTFRETTEATLDDIVERIRNGDEAAFERIFRQYYAPLCRFAATYTGVASIAEEVVAEMFARLWADRASWRPSVSLAAALYGATRRRAIDVFRAMRAESRRYDTSLAADEHWGAGASPADAAWLAESEDERTRIWGVIATLPASQRTVLALRWRDGFSWDEIAVVIGTTPVAVKRQHSRAIATLRELFAEHLR